MFGRLKRAGLRARSAGFVRGKRVGSALALLCASACARESAPTRPSAQPEPVVEVRGDPATAAQRAAPAPALPAVPLSTQEAAVRALAESIVALGQGPLGTPTQLKARLALPEQTKWSFDTPKRTSVDVSGATLTLTMRNGTWEPPLGNSAFHGREPTVESIELRGPGSLGLSPPASARVVATHNFHGPAVVVTWPGDFYLGEAERTDARDAADEPKPEGLWYLGRFVGRAPFHYTEEERRSLEVALIGISGALAKGGLDLFAHMAKHYAPLRHPNPELVGYAPKNDDSKARAAGGSAVLADVQLFDFGAGLVLVEPTSLRVRFVGPMQMPAFFAAHGVKMIETFFAHDVGQMVRSIEAPGLSIRPADYFFGEKDSRRDAEMGAAAEAKLLDLLIVAREGR